MADRGKVGLFHLSLAKAEYRGRRSCKEDPVGGSMTHYSFVLTGKPFSDVFLPLRRQNPVREFDSKK